MTNLASELPYWHFDNDFMVFNDGSLGVGFRLSGFDLSCTTDEEINQFAKSTENLFLTCNDGLRLQLLYKLSPNVSSHLEAHSEQVDPNFSEYQPIWDARKKWLLANQEREEYFSPEIYLFCRSKAFKYPKQKLFEKQDKYQQTSQEKYKEHYDEFERIAYQIESALISGKLNPQMIKSDDWYNLIFEQLNFERTKKLPFPKLRADLGPLNPSLNNQICLTDMECFKDKLSFGETSFRVITMKLLPEGFTIPAIIEELTRLSFHFWISQNIHILDQAKERKKLETGRRIAHSMASGSQNVSDLESESKLGNIEALLSEILEGSTKLLSTDLNVIVWGKSKEELDEKCDEVLRAFRNLNQAEGLIETLPLKEVFLNTLPGTCTGLRHHICKSSNVAHLMPLYSAWSGNQNPVSLLPNRDRALFSLDPFDSSLPNWNGVVFGGSGSGKSFTVSQLMLSFAGKKNRPRIFWIDNGASSKGLVDVLGGEFIDFNLSSGITINMFDLPKGCVSPTPDKIKLILAVLELILKEEDKPSLPKRHKSLLEEVIYRVYQHKKNPVLSDLRELLSKHQQDEMRQYADVLFSWTGDTAYGRMLDGQTNVEFEKDLVAFEVQSLNANGELKDAVLLLLTSYINDMAMADINREYMLIVDEAERLFRAELAKQFVITCYRTWRKYRSAIWCLSQNYKDFMQDKSLKDSLMPNANNVIILRQRKIDWKHFQETFDFNDAQVAAIKSLEIVKGKYSEFFFLQDENQAILRLVPEPLSYWICTTDGIDKAKIEELQRKEPNKSKIEILQKLAGIKGGLSEETLS